METPFEVRGVIVPLLTPMSRNGEQIDERSLQSHVDWLVKKGVHGLMPCGTTGEAPLLAQAEREIITEIVIAAAGGRVPVIAHVGAITTRETVELAEHAAAVGVSAISVITPYYFALTDAALTEHFCRVAAAAPHLPMYLYNLPARAGNHVSRACAEAVIGRCPNVVGIKDSSGDLTTLSSFIGLGNGRFQVACGSDALLFRGLQAGATAGVSGNANVFPEVLTGLFEAFWRGDLATAARCQETLDFIRSTLQDGRHLALYKYVLELRGLCSGGIRPPLPPTSSAEATEAAAKLRAAGLV
jgi:dihydrodipicolinate synthase/N-acetylneuraminate lyase